MRVAITGATGFVGHALVKRLAQEPDCIPLALTRSESNNQVRGVQYNSVGELSQDTDWRAALQGIGTVVHAAARVHVMRDTAVNPLDEFRRINVAGTLNLARQAADTGVGRFVFLSSIKVNGEETPVGKPFRADDIPAPVDAYSISKWEAEQGLMAVARETGMEVVCIRPPLVYGPGVKANFHSMMRWLNKGIPLPLGAILNKRSLVALDNLVDLIVTCLDHPAAANQIFLVGDGEDLSTTELLQRMASALGRPARLLPVPAWLLEVGAAMVGKRDVAQRLLGSLQVDISKTRELLGWTPPVSVDEGLRKTAEHFLKTQE